MLATRSKFGIRELRGKRYPTFVVLEVSSPSRDVQVGRNVVEEGLLSCGGHSVDAAEGKTKETIVVGVALELRRNSLGSLNSLGLEGNATDGHGVSVDVTAGRATITVGDLPRSTAELLGGAALAGVVLGLSVDGAGGKLSAEDPEIRRTGVEVQVEGLSRSTDGDRGQVLDIVLLGSGLGASAVTAGDLEVGNGLSETLR